MLGVVATLKVVVGLGVEATLKVVIGLGFVVEADTIGKLTGDSVLALLLP